MKPIRASIMKSLVAGSNLVCADNSGAKVIQIIAVFGYKGRRGRQPKAGVANMIKIVVKQGNVKVRSTMSHAVIIRQKAEYRRPDGMRVSFEDNAAVLTNENGDPKGTDIKGPIAKEAVERFSQLGKIASVVV